MSLGNTAVKAIPVELKGAGRSVAYRIVKHCVALAETYSSSQGCP
jgi:hypothetical protein